MRIGVDAKRAFMNATGLGNYSRNIILSLVENDSENDYILYTPKIKNTEFKTQIEDFKNVTIVTFNSIFDFWFRSFGITKLIQKQADIYLGLSNELPLNIRKFKGKKIVVIHDLIPFKEDIFVKIHEIFFYKKKLRSAINHSDKIVAISQATKLDIIEKFGNDNIDVIYQPFTHIRKNLIAEDIQKVKNKYALPDKFFLQVGRMEYRKNIQQVLAAFNLIKSKTQLNYICVGKETRFTKSLKSFVTNFKLNDKVHFFHQVSSTELAAFYQLSQFTIYPSKYEGFGLPIIESLCYEKPIITTKGGCFEEAGGNLATYVDTNNQEEIAEKILEFENELPKISLPENHLEKFDSKKIASQFLNLFR